VDLYEAHLFRSTTWPRTSAREIQLACESSADSGRAGNLMDPVAQKMMNLFPEPNTNGDLQNNWFGSGSRRNYNDQFDIKIDHRFNQNNLISGKFAYQYSHSKGQDCFKNFTDPCAAGPGWTNAHLFAVNYVHTFSSTLLMNLTSGFTRGVWHIDSYNPHGENDPLGTLGFPSYLQSKVGGWKTNGIWRISDGRPLTFQGMGLLCLPMVRSDPT
jgi:hypothetical protein